MQNELRILSPTAILGYGFPKKSFERGLEMEPDLIAVDAGSVDPGPYYLGEGVSFTDKTAVKRDLKIMLKAAQKINIPVIVGTAGGSGADPHLKWCTDIVKEIAKEEKLNFKLASIQAEQKKSEILEKFQSGKISPLFPVSELSQSEIEASTHIVAQMGVEPFIKALDMGAEVIIAGRAYDPSVFASYCIQQGFNPGLALHMGKIMECASIAADPGSGSDSMFAILKDDHFILEPLNKERKCTTTSVAAHTLYEKTDPYKLAGPGGIIDLSESEFEQIDERRVKVSGSKFIADKNYTLKLEAAKEVGYRTISIAGIRDSIMIKNLDHIINEVKASVIDNFDYLKKDEYQLLFKVYGKNAVMDNLEVKNDIKAHELGLVIEVVAESQELANTICSFARSTMLHYGYPDRVGTAGNLAFPYSPSDIKAGKVYEFSIHHLLKVENPCELFSIEIDDI